MNDTKKEYPIESSNLRSQGQSEVPPTPVEVQAAIRFINECNPKERQMLISIIVEHITKHANMEIEIAKTEILNEEDRIIDREILLKFINQTIK